MSLAAFLKKLNNKESLSAGETQLAFDVIFEGKAEESELGAFLLALHEKGETADDIRGAVTSMRAKAITIVAPANAIDIVGTGGDARGTLNISTAASLVTAACGLPVAKHGNRAATSKSGSSDVLSALGINLEPTLSALETCLHEAHLCFLFAPRHHPAMRHVAAIRKKLGIRTIFNLLGPLTNPANVKKHLIGVYAKELMQPMADVLRSLGSDAAWLTHGRDGMDELTTMATTDVLQLSFPEGAVSTIVRPEDFGLRKPELHELQGGDAAYNATALRNLLAGHKNAYRDIVALNAAAALVVGGKAIDIREGLLRATESLDSGAAHDTLQKLIDITNRVSS